MVTQSDVLDKILPKPREMERPFSNDKERTVGSFFGTGKWAHFLQRTSIGHEEGRLNQPHEACIASPQSTPEPSSSSDADDEGRSYTVSRSSLPYDMVALILADFSLAEVARMSTMCTAFHAVYLQRMAALQKSRVDLALSFCGPERIECIVALIADLLLGEPLKQDFGPVDQSNRFSISGDGVLDGPMPNPLGIETIETGDLWVMFLQKGSYVWCNFNPVDVPSYKRSFLSAQIRPDCKWVVINVKPSHDEDFRPVGVLQAMLSGGLAEFLDVTGKWAYINIIPQKNSAGGMAMKEHVVPLLPFARRYMAGHQVHAQIGEGPAADEREQLGLGRVERMVELRGPASHQRTAFGLGRVGRVVEFMPQCAPLRSVVGQGRVERMLNIWRLLREQLRGGRQNPQV